MNPTLAALQAKLNAAYTNYLHAIQGLESDKRSQPGVSGAWTAKDIVAHLTGWNAALHEFIIDPENFNPEPLYDVHTFNASSVAKRESQTWQETVHEWQTTFTNLNEALATLLKEGCMYDRVVSWLEGRIADYEFHLEQLNDWLKQTPPAGQIQ